MLRIDGRHRGSAALFSRRFNGAVSWFTVDLDLPPSKRWTAVISEKKTEVGISAILVIMCKKSDPFSPL